ncbi:hypothetical protein GCM10009716_06600 [Streptomyces sodiiphilus]|uniref:Uncharacterized protein n=1 Tax=Streptomyces sodiiphilus TaxID=226217 RepID=A0ABP5A1S0_9ACTN
MTTAVGLYSISVQNFDVPELLEWAHREAIPFVHLRGGPRGYDLARRPVRTLRAWHGRSLDSVPVTGVTADTDLYDLFTPDHAVRTRARADVLRLADAAAELGAGWVRLLARAPIPSTRVSAVGTLAVPEAAVPLLAELHHPHWLTTAAITSLGELLCQTPYLRFLADTAQLAASPPDDGHSEALGWVMARSDVLHLSDNGRGLTDGHLSVAAAAAAQVRAGHRIEVGVEWTGRPRSPSVCLNRYRRSVAWWHAVTGLPIEP